MGSRLLAFVLIYDSISQVDSYMESEYPQGYGYLLLVESNSNSSKMACLNLLHDSNGQVDNISTQDQDLMIRQKVIKIEQSNSYLVKHVIMKHSNCPELDNSSKPALSAVSSFYSVRLVLPTIIFSVLICHVYWHIKQYLQYVKIKQPRESPQITGKNSLILKI